MPSGTPRWPLPRGRRSRRAASPRPVPTSCSARPAERQDAHARLHAAAGDDERQVGTGHRLAVGRLAGSAQRPEAIQRRTVDRVLRVGGHLLGERRDPVLRHPESDQQLECAVIAVLDEDRGHGGADCGRARLHDDAQRLVQVVRTREGRRARGEDGERAGAGGGFGHECLRDVPRWRGPSGSTGGTPRASSWRVGIVHRRSAPFDLQPRGEHAGAPCQGAGCGVRGPLVS